MGRIIYLCPFAQGAITGGIKTAYRHVEILGELGYDAWIWQPDGAPGWLGTKAPRLSGGVLVPKSDDVLVFPEVIHEAQLAGLASIPLDCTKLLFCQNQYFVFNELIPRKTYAELGFRDVFCCSQAAKGLLERVLGLKDVTVVPCFVDAQLYKPTAKTLQIAAVPRKRPKDASLIAYMFKAKYPDARGVPFAVIENQPEAEMARILSQSAILLSLSHLESLGLIPLEAMAAGCLVAGYHGFGGLEYATDQNGLWFSSDEHEAVADALYSLVKRVENNDPAVAAMIAAGHATAAAYNRERTAAALGDYFRGLGIVPGCRPTVP